MNTITPLLDQVIYGDCVTVMRSMPSACVDLIVTDPPYLVGYRARDGRQCLNDNNDHWLKPSFREMYRLLRSDTFCISFYGWPWVERFMVAWKDAGFRPVSHLVWLKSHCSRKGYTRSHHEVGFLLAKGRPRHPLKSLSDVLPWQYTRNEYHPNQKPIVSLTPLIEALSNPTGIILDPFAGSGSTGLAARACGRHYVLIERDCGHWRVAKERLL
jgi:adenine-specific DNA-methyltransferase